MPPALVDYSDSDSDQGTNSKPSGSPLLKRKRPSTDQDQDQATNSLPPLPASFHDLYSTNTRTSTSDDPSLHGGRKRQIPHIQGNWPTHVYLEWHPTPAETASLNTLLSKTGCLDKDAGVHSLLLSDLSAPLPLHISLSQSLVLKTEQRDNFLERATANVRVASVRPFTVDFLSLAWYPNHDRTRWFLSLSVSPPAHNELNKLLDACNKASRSMDQPMLYLPNEEETPQGTTKKQKEPRTCVGDAKMIAPKPSVIPDCSDSFHISLAWSLSPHELNGEALSSKTIQDALKALETTFDVVKVKIGNAINVVPLFTKACMPRSGILGL